MASRLAGLLRAAGGETALFPSLGRWMQAVSQMLDGGALQYSLVRLNAGAQSFAAIGDVLLDDEVLSVGGLVYTPGTGLWQLEANRLYELEFFGAFENFGGVGDVAQVSWVDTSNNELVAPTGGSLGGYYIPGTSNINASVKPVTRLLYQTSVATSVKLRVTNVTSTVDLSIGSYAIVRRIA